MLNIMDGKDFYPYVGIGCEGITLLFRVSKLSGNIHQDWLKFSLISYKYNDKKSKRLQSKTLRRD
jgi:hypothetical protein